MESVFICIEASKSCRYLAMHRFYPLQTYLQDAEDYLSLPVKSKECEHYSSLKRLKSYTFIQPCMNLCQSWDR